MRSFGSAILSKRRALPIRQPVVGRSLFGRDYSSSGFPVSLDQASAGVGYAFLRNGKTCAADVRTVACSCALREFCLPSKKKP